MQPLVMGCAHCDVEIRGSFRASPFQSLPDEQQAFLEKYLLAGFSIKALEEETGMGYVAIRSRLDKLIDSYRVLVDAENQRIEILDRVAKGEISAEEGAERLRRMGDV